jgi:chromosome partitioning protein
MIITIFTVKGGTGKTTTIINLAGAIAQIGKKVLIVDNDPQSNVTKRFKLKDQSEYTIYDLYTNKKVDIYDCIVKYNENIDVAVNSIKSARIPKEISSMPNKENILKHKLRDLKGYDYVLIDNSPFISDLTRNSLACSDYILSVIDNSIDSLEGLELVFQEIEDVQDSFLNPDLEFIGILRNNFDKKTIISKQFSQVAEDNYKELLFKTIIYSSVKHKEIAALGTTIQEYSEEHEVAYRELLIEIEDRSV